ncbi:MAG: tRNA uridine(34) 5-carboxymethylaminomethyl modification radical SAM/GNAT enzyme Elp3 [Candidatus Micrarchaeota archaeon]
MDTRKKAIAEIVRRLLHGEDDLDKIKREAGRRYRIAAMIKNSELLASVPKSKMTRKLGLMLRKKPTRTLSGITSIAVMIKPEGSCTRECIYCPFTGKAAKSYTGEEPAALRARQFSFDPIEQVRGRIVQLGEMGHPTEKCELILMGGTFLEMNPKYKRSFVKGIYDALNGRKEKTLASAIRMNETAKHRAIGFTFETRPDVCTKKHIDEILSYGATRVELGVQHPDDKIYSSIRRGHTVKEVVDATRELKDSAFKVLYHVMPGLPGSGKRKDVSMVRRLFRDERFKPDMLKIYPTLVIPGTVLERMVKDREFRPYSSEKAAEIIAEMHRHIPPYVRVMRIQRDIPAGLIAGGVRKSNLRQLVNEQLNRKKITSLEIRGREIGLQGPGAHLSDFSIRRMEYNASGGTENFISFENRERLIAGFIRMRIPGKSHRREITDSTALIRELHVYGSEVPIEKKGDVQHQGIGAQLLSEAEKVAAENFGKKKMVILSGVGVREYYFRHGYRRLGPYVAKELS